MCVGRTGLGKGTVSSTTRESMADRNTASGLVRPTRRFQGASRDVGSRGCQGQCRKTWYVNPTRGRLHSEGDTVSPTRAQTEATGTG